MSMKQQTEMVLFTSSAPDTWCLTRRGVQPWMCLTIARSDNQTVVGTIDTNDIEKVKESISSPIDSIFIKAMHIVAPSSSGVSAAEVLDFVEAKLDGNIVFYRLQTKFGATQIDGQLNLLTNQLEQCTLTSLYRSASETSRYEERQP
ncbi:MAG: hypothetical protein A3J24_04410 [Deltaproteobacteria bacterium RIFCSPLOWO2_02_FULL_53_8]|nr:MAG: hypothetical protein A3J24_04410 [Deltaproteobacteria bacterium RIFCSPLOWO2_02_FULL_53_8]